MECNGIIHWFSPATNMLCDQKAWNSLGIHTWFEDRPGICIIADAGFTLNPKNKPHITETTPHRHKQKGKPLSMKKTTDNIELS